MGGVVKRELKISIKKFIIQIQYYYKIHKKLLLKNIFERNIHHKQLFSSQIQKLNTK